MHRKLHTGSVIQISVNNLNSTLGAPHPGLPAATYGNVFKQFPRTVYHLARPVPGVGTDPAFEAVQNGADANMARNFVWLPYHPGYLTMVPFVPDMSIVTGWMTGCYLALVRVQGVEYFLHVGTDSHAHHPNTINVKNLLKLAIGQGHLTVQKVFKPIAHGSPNALGVVSARRNFYTLGLSMSHTSSGAMKNKIDSKTLIGPEPALPDLGTGPGRGHTPALPYRY